MSYKTVANAVQLGRAGELIAMAAFEIAGLKGVLVNQVGFDILAFDEDGNSYRVEVKSSSHSQGLNKISYKFMTSTGSSSKKALNKEDADIIVLVALDIKRIVARCASTLPNKRTSITLDEFDEPETLQIQRAITEVRKRKNGRAKLG